MCPCCTDRKGIPGGPPPPKVLEKILWATRPTRTLLKLSSKWTTASRSVTPPPPQIVLEGFIRRCRGLQKNLQSIRRATDWQERQRKGRTLTLALGAASRAGAASLRKQVPLLGQAPSEPTHLAGKRDSVKHLPLPCCTRHLCSGSSPRAAPREGPARPGPAPTGDGQVCSRSVLARGVTQIVSGLECWEGGDQAVTWFSL